MTSTSNRHKDFAITGGILLLTAFGALSCAEEDAPAAPPEAAPPAAPPAWPPTEPDVRANIEAAFARLSSGQIAEHVDRAFSSPGATLVIHARTDLGPGTFVGPSAVLGGFQQLFRAVPTHRFEIQEMWVVVGAEEVTAAVAWTDDAKLPDGTSLPAEGMNRIRLGRTGIIREDLFIVPLP